MTPDTTELALLGLEKAYGQSRAVADVSLEVGKGELLALLGPSGCGKTTTLRMVAGFIAPDRGRILLAGKDITGMPPHRRDTGMVFQSYALFPHLTVSENVAFGLKRRGVAKAETAQRVSRMLALLRLDGLGDRLPRQLSGGQQQRVAVGRALVINPAMVLLDEPFSNLDALLRESTRVELRHLQQSFGLTTLFVTHDQAEAMAISDRIAVMNGGRIEQIGDPRSIYGRPANRFVASFIGKASIFDCGPARETSSAGHRLTSHDGVALDVAAAPSGPCAVVVRPEAMRLEPGSAPGPNRVAGRIEVASYLGSVAQLVLRAASQRAVLVEGPADLADRFPPGAEATALWPPEGAYACPP
jgi:putative spermidine/putrescine transport system ATP-binding protein